MKHGQSLHKKINEFHVPELENSLEKSMLPQNPEINDITIEIEEIK